MSRLGGLRQRYANAAARGRRRLAIQLDNEADARRLAHALGHARLFADRAGDVLVLGYLSRVKAAERRLIVDTIDGMELIAQLGSTGPGDFHFVPDH